MKEFVCPKCGQKSHRPGSCPKCKLALIESCPNCMQKTAECYCN